MSMCARLCECPKCEQGFSCSAIWLQCFFAWHTSLTLCGAMAKPLGAAHTKEGTLPPFEVAKAYAFEQVLSLVEKRVGKSSRQLLGEDKATFIAKHLMLQGGGTPSRTTVFKAIRKCSRPGWHPGQAFGKRTGRPPAFTLRQKKAMAKAAMETKRRLVKPTPGRVRAKVPKLCLNPETQAPASNCTIYKIFHTLCYDEAEDDPWVYMHSPAKDYLSDDMRKHRIAFAQHFLHHTHASAWRSHVAIDPCISVLPRTCAQTEDQKVAAMGVQKMMSRKSRFKGANLRAPATAKTQGRAEDKVHWTPVFARGKVFVYICDAKKASRDPKLPARLNSGEEIAKFVQHVLPGVLELMQQEHGWANTPRTIVHDKASYFVGPRSQRLSKPFADALHASRLKSWLGDGDADCSWLAGRLGDVYPHETLIRHICGGLEEKFPRLSPGETPARFAYRMNKVNEFLNSEEFAAPSWGGLSSLARSLLSRCSRVLEEDGWRLRT